MDRFTVALVFVVRNVGIATAFAVTVLHQLEFTMFATAYFVMGRADPADFSEALTRSDALYFTVTVFATVGFGDVSPQGETTRLVVTGQMILDLIFLGVGIRTILGAVQRSKERSTNGGAP